MDSVWLELIFDGTLGLVEVVLVALKSLEQLGSVCFVMDFNHHF